ncbi:acetyltransferase [Nakamurella silvestris]|nr:acetyltransferase [Nakamurella silvestris]
MRIWRSAVTATHDFLGPEDIADFEVRIPRDLLPQVRLTVAVLNGSPVGFAGVAGGNLEMLFVDDAFRGRGVGTALLQAELAENPQLTTDVNEQNPQALSFYRRQGYVVVGRSEIDGDGRPFPLLHLARTR